MLGLPKPDLVLYLDMPTEITEKMMRSREAATGTHADIHEQDEAYLKSCREAAREIVKDCGWTVIHCARDGDAPRTRGGYPQSRCTSTVRVAAVRPVPPAGRGASPPGVSSNRNRCGYSRFRSYIRCRSIPVPRSERE